MARYQVLLSATLAQSNAWMNACMHFFRNSRELFCPAKFCLYEGGPDASDPSLLKGLYIADLLQFETK